MSRLKQKQNIDSLIDFISRIKKNRCSHSEEDQLILQQILDRLIALKRKKGKTNDQVLEIVLDIIKFFS
jgi:hypothetical protein